MGHLLLISLLASCKFEIDGFTKTTFSLYFDPSFSVGIIIIDGENRDFIKVYFSSLLCVFVYSVFLYRFVKVVKVSMKAVKVPRREKTFQQLVVNYPTPLWLMTQMVSYSNFINFVFKIKRFYAKNMEGIFFS